MPSKPPRRPLFRTEYSGQNNMARIFEVSQEFFRISRDGRPFTQFFAHFKKLYEKYNSLLPISSEVGKMKTQREQLAVMGFLGSLVPEFESVRSQLLSSTELPSLTDTFARVLRVSRETSTVGIDPDKSASKSALLTSVTSDSKALPHNGGRDRFTSPGRGRGISSSGRGPVVNIRNAGRGSQPTVLGPCYHCGEYGHVQRFCRHIAATSRMANIAKSGQSMASSNTTITLSPAKYEQPSPSTLGLVQTGNGDSSACLTTSLPWVIDSGASDHMTCISSNLSDFQPVSDIPSVTLANGSKVIVKGTGTATLSPSLSLSSTLFLPEFPFNLLSVSKLTKSYNCSITFFPGSCVFQDLTTKKEIGRGHVSGGLHVFNETSSRSIACSGVVSPLQIHCRLGHPSLASLKKLVPSLHHLESLNCESCQFGKHHHVSYPPRVNKRSAHHFDLVHSDVWGPCPVDSKLGFRYFVTFVDDYSRVTWLYLMKSRSELFSIFVSFVTKIQTQFRITLKTLRSDNAKEYFSTSFSSFMRQHGIIHESSCVDTPQQNGVPELNARIDIF